ncbi:MAG: 3-phosphoshikimate 1-carboxyvinyltransferase [Oscillospiraceae bacterium]|nr:3-phosphoshikimate 1-carboxyvinyltransferase [Oscillospiraceae bacterium]
MRVKIEKSVAQGVAKAPPSKSMAHRALICGALSKESRIYNLAASEDIKATLGCLKALGAKIEEIDGGIKICALDPVSAPENAELFCNESGSTLRFFVPLCMLSGKKITLKGSRRLFERPLSIYEEICKDQGIELVKGGDSVTVCGRLKSGSYSVAGNISSQFITGLLFALPLLEGDSKLEVTGKFESASYIDLTLSALNAFGIEIKREANVFYIKGSQSYKNAEYTVEGDMSNAAFLEGFNLLGGDVTVEGINDNTLQGDRAYIDMYKGLLKGKKSFDLSDCPDLAPVMFALSAFHGGATFTGTARLKIKESDRASAMAEELLKFGIDCEIKENSVEIKKGKLVAPTENLWGHNDHRIVMALSLLLSKTGGSIEGAEAVKKSYPDFFEVIKNLGIGMEKYDN